MTAHFPQDWIEQARAIRIEDLAAKRSIHLRRIGRNELAGPCPHCGGDDRFSVNKKEQVFNCRGCQRGGHGAIDFVMFLDKSDFNEAVEKLAGPAPKSNGHDHDSQPVKTGEWTYRDENKMAYLMVHRVERIVDGKKKKDYFQYRVELHGDKRRWTRGKPNGPKIPYRLPQLLAANHAAPVWITEGEKCADAVASLGLVATTASEGAGNWTADLNEWFRDRIVYILPDNDLPGTRHAEQVAENLTSIAKAVCIVNLPGLENVKEDVFDWIARGGDRDQLVLLGSATPEWKPEGKDEASGGAAAEESEAISQGAEGIQEKLEPAPAPTPRIVITLAEFLAKFIAPDYLVDLLLQRGFLYSLTGATGAGKTAIGPLLAVTVALRRPGQKFGPYAVEHGRVVYIAAENGTDVQMRFPPLLERFSVKPEELDMLVIDTIKNIDKELPAIERDIREFGPVDLIIVDTSPRLFLGDNFNDDKQMLDHAIRLRKLTELPGKPCVVALGHPIKYPKSPEDLLPKGGGAYLNEMDGNLTLWKHDDHLTDLHWTGKFRGPDFQPITFKLEVSYSPTNVDKKGSPLPTVTATHVSDAESEAIEADAANQEVVLLGAIQDKPRGTFNDWATSCGWFVKGDRSKPNKMKVTRLIKTAEKAKLVQKSGRTYTITKAGKAALTKDSPQEEDAE